MSMIVYRKIQEVTPLEKTDCGIYREKWWAF